MSIDPGIVPGALVRLPAEPGWGDGQVQTVVGPKVTVNFENAGKRVVNCDMAALELVAPEREP